MNYQLTDEVLVGWDSNFSSGVRLNRSSIDNGNTANAVVEKDGYGVSDAWLDYQITSIAGLSVQFAVENIFDKDYQNHNSFGLYWGNADYNDSEVGRNFKLAASYQF